MINFLKKSPLLSLQFKEANIDIRYKLILLYNVFLFAVIVAFIMGFVRLRENILLSAIDFTFTGVIIYILYYLFTVCVYLTALFLIIENYGLIQKEQNKNLKRLNERLGQEVRDRTKELEIANNSLIETNNQMIYTLSEISMSSHSKSFLFESH